MSTAPWRVDIVTCDSLGLRDDFCSSIDALGVLSGVDQNLKGPITAIDKLKETNHVLFVHVSGDSKNEKESECVKGYLKVGRKTLFFYTPKGKVVEMASVPVCLDFFVDPACQRSGVGKSLFDFMLQAWSLSAPELAYDRPSGKLTAFLSKHFQLCCQDLQPNRYAIYPQEGFPLN